MSIAFCSKGHGCEAGKPCPQCVIAPSMAADDAVQCPKCRQWRGATEDHRCQATGAVTLGKRPVADTLALVGTHNFGLATRSGVAGFASEWERTVNDSVRAEAPLGLDLAHFRVVPPVEASPGRFMAFDDARMRAKADGLGSGAPEDPSAVRSERNHLLAVNEHLQRLVAATQKTADEFAALNRDLVAKLDAKTPTAEVTTLRNEVALLQRRLAGLKMRVNSEEGDTNGLVAEARAAARDAQIELNWYRHELERVNPRLVEAHERNGAKPTPAAARRSSKDPF